MPIPAINDVSFANSDNRSFSFHRRRVCSSSHPQDCAPGLPSRPSLSLKCHTGCPALGCSSDNSNFHPRHFTYLLLLLSGKSPPSPKTGCFLGLRGTCHSPPSLLAWGNPGIPVPPLASALSGNRSSRCDYLGLSYFFCKGPESKYFQLCKSTVSTTNSSIVS